MAKTNKFKTRRYHAIAIQKKSWNFRMVSFFPDAADLYEWCGVYRKSITRKGYQRNIKKNHAEDIQKFLDASSTNVIPNSIVIAFNDQLKDGGLKKESARFIPIKNSSLPKQDRGDDTEIVVGVLEVSVHPTCLQDQGEITTEERENRLADVRSAYVIDGQHRLHGGNLAESDAYFPVTAFLGINKEDQAFHFIIINGKATKVTKHQIDSVIPKALYRSLQGRLLKAGFKASSTDIVWALDKDSDSPFQHAITWPNHEDHGNEAFIAKGGIDRIISEYEKLPDDLTENNDADAILKPAWRGIKRAIGAAWCEEKKIRVHGDYYHNQFIIKNAAVLHALQKVFNDTVRTSLIKIDETEKIENATYKYFKSIPLEFWYCTWVAKSIQNDDKIGQLYSHIQQAIRTKKVPYSTGSDWFLSPNSIESQRRHKKLTKKKKSTKSKKKINKKKKIIKKKKAGKAKITTKRTKR
ncbi:DGQHR domain-containing protein [Pirellulales bacterium]|nr:DGQHR domain-containing protein [Pirellulales bacterium]